MAVEVVMPKLSDTMEEGRILKWLKRVGDQVAPGDVLAEVETDKADMELEATDGGVLSAIKAEAGASVSVGAVIALVEEGGRRAPARDAAGDGGRPERAPAAADEAASAPPGPGAGEPVRASPSARKIAEERGIDLRSVKGSGPGGRIVKEDVERERSEPERPAAPRPPARAAAGGERQELSRMRQSIARRMSEAFREIPHFYVTAEIDMTEAARLKDALAASGLYTAAISYTHLVLKATALALRRHPRLNASFRDDGIELKGEINLGMAVALDEGLIVPVLRGVDGMPLAEIAREARRLAEQARQGRFASEDLSGGTFTISNMGMLDIEEFAAVINPPQAAILAVGAVKERPVVRGGAVVAGRTMRVTVSCDHRIIDGVVAGRFLEELKRLLENPIVLVVREG
jgi:pyruvate dehydrogenase E2 component (dihydrolipoamide acetyltransferase)